MFAKGSQIHFYKIVNCRAENYCASISDIILSINAQNIGIILAHSLIHKEAKMRLLKVLYKLETVEERMGELYWALHRKFENNKKASQLFYKLYIEERNHVALVLYEKRIVWQNQDDFEDVEFDFEAIDAFIREIEKTFQRIRSITVREAVRAALQFESDAAEKHLGKGFAKSNLRFALFVESLGKCDEEHIAKIRKFLETLPEDDVQETADASGNWALINLQQAQ
jgi:hypothetical protein